MLLIIPNFSSPHLYCVFATIYIIAIHFAPIVPTWLCYMPSPLPFSPLLSRPMRSQHAFKLSPAEFDVSPPPTPPPLSAQHPSTLLVSPPRYLLQRAVVAPLLSPTPPEQRHSHSLYVLILAGMGGPGFGKVWRNALHCSAFCSLGGYKWRKGMQLVGYGSVCFGEPERHEIWIILQNFL